ncbi:MAG: hypothetical protein ACK4MF_12130, partial [Hyphomicrobiaceae bacterium]
MQRAALFFQERARDAHALVAPTFFALTLAPLGLVLFELRDHDGQRIVQLALLAVAAAVVAVHTMLRPGGAVDPSRRALGLAATLGVLGVLSILNSEIARAAALEAGVLLALAMFAIGIGPAAQRLGIERLLVIPVAASVLFAFAVAVRYGAALSADASLLREHLLPAYSNYRFFNHVQTVTIPLLVGAVLAGPSRLRRWAAVTLVAEFALLFFTGGRATMLALGAAAAAI